MAGGREVDMQLHVGEVQEEVVDLSEVGVAIKGMNVVGSEREGSRVGSGEGHCGVFTMVGVMS